jgi:hypothetical protein
MRKIATFLAASLALVSAQAANATTYSPTGTWVFQGTADVYKGIQLNCNVTVTVNASATSATATMSLSGGFLNLCNTVGFDPSYTPYNVTYDSATSTVTLEDVYVNTITSGDCFGDVSAIWNDATNTLTVNDTIEEAVPGSGDCVITNGNLSLTSPGDVTIS